MEKTTVKQAVPLQPMEVDGGEDIHLQPMEDPMLEQVETPKGGCDPVGSPRWNRLLAGPVAPWKEEPTLEQSAPEGLHPVGEIHAGAVREELQHMGKDSRWRSLWRTVSRGRDPMLEQGKSVRSPPPEEEGAAETACDELTTTPVPHPPVLLRGRRESKVKPGKKGEVEGGVFKF
ncbi:AN1-type zinc finger protein 5-like [Grus japonensis]|uniref:AN1-type zinc finger protein 5-like n=1 Tax=Grus japonensis TaxID=30415 RepID=A0ABC9WNH2_GRUJA